MFEQTYKLVKFFKESKRINGRKKLQKTIHLLQHFGNDFDMNYYYHYYGPYSSDLQAEVQFLVDQGLVKEERLFDGYIYNITDRGEDFLKSFEEKFDVDDSSLFFDKLDALKEKNASFLEVLSTFVYLLESGYDKELAIEKTKELKANLSHLLEDVIVFFENELQGN